MHIFRLFASVSFMYHWKRTVVSNFCLKITGSSLYRSLRSMSFVINSVAMMFGSVVAPSACSCDSWQASADARVVLFVGTVPFSTLYIPLAQQQHAAAVGDAFQ
jgi:hypothetical protein